MALLHESEKACCHADDESVGDESLSAHALDRFLCGGGTRAGRHAGSSRKHFFIGSPQHGEVTTCGGFGCGMWSAPMSSGRTVWKAMRSRIVKERIALGKIRGRTHAGMELLVACLIGFTVGSGCIGRRCLGLSCASFRCILVLVA